VNEDMPTDDTEGSDDTTDEATENEEASGEE
jgi:hypothetical protein